jgi:hypothetical protein
MQRIFLVLLTAIAIGAAMAQDLKAIPENLKPAANESLKRVISAKGVQIYECRDQKWVFVAPEAELYDERGNLIGRHYAGPHWEATGDGSKVLGTVKTRADAPEAGAIPWLLLGTKSVGATRGDVTSASGRYPRRRRLAAARTTGWWRFLHRRLLLLPREVSRWVRSSPRR